MRRRDNAEHQNICNDHGVKYAKCGHTPGPWNIETEEHQYGDLAATRTTRYRICTPARTVAILPGFAEQDKASARLIAAAPDAHSIIQRLSDFIPGESGGQIDTDEFVEWLTMEGGIEAVRAYLRATTGGK